MGDLVPHFWWNNDHALVRSAGSHDKWEMKQPSTVNRNVSLFYSDPVAAFVTRMTCTWFSQLYHIGRTANGLALQFFATGVHEIWWDYRSKTPLWICATSIKYLRVVVPDTRSTDLIWFGEKIKKMLHLAAKVNIPVMKCFIIARERIFVMHFILSSLAWSVATFRWVNYR